jgi:hypothetical protein
MAPGIAVATAFFHLLLLLAGAGEAKAALQRQAELTAVLVVVAVDITEEILLRGGMEILLQLVHLKVITVAQLVVAALHMVAGVAVALLRLVVMVGRLLLVMEAQVLRLASLGFLQPTQVAVAVPGLLVILEVVALAVAVLVMEPLELLILGEVEDLK